MRDQKCVCQYCDGAGWFDDTTYDRCGVMTICSRCYGSGLPVDSVRQIITEAFAPFRLPKPKE